MSSPTHPNLDDEDLKVLHSMGYAQELARNMKGFQNFAISFSIICILSGGINSLGQGISGLGGGAIGVGWIVGCALTLLFALCMAQIGSAYPTAGGLYHWGSILGGRGFGWLTAWLNLLGLVTVLGAINVGTYNYFIGAFGPMLGLETSFGLQAAFVAGITLLQAIVNHVGIRATARLTDLSGYLIFAVAVGLTVALLAYAPQWDFSRLVTFKNYSGPAGGDVWPATDNMLLLFGLGLLLPIYTVTGFDASAHTAEETQNAARAVPKGIINSVIWSALFGWLMLSAFVLAIPDMDKAAASGWNVFFDTLGAVLPAGLKTVLYVLILVCQLLCGLATVTSASRMIFAFARDGGLPASAQLKRIHPRFRTPVAAIWTAAIISLLFTLYTPAYTTIVSVTVIFIFLSYGLPIAAGVRAYGSSWTTMGPWSMGPMFRVVGVLAVLAVLIVFFLGVQPPNDNALPITLAFLALTAVVWFGFERRRFQGPPVGDEVLRRQAEIAAAERALQATP
ncbi:amino acid permease [Sphaerotilus mobilis]|uniref:Amino acid/polyamine/organocation transporter (APC superfamily) n=1 Tax=Sphaerotilus mobilis TaxID=47994 RepID=A0A4Q7L8G0_9BURK|nr:amino acid permease [Sphaerotilus mobilis]RZS46709.1 amino acid/polyamine/organocation transporter (APC superfamily) [Sphaerotilus mobilis]